jgi:ABC-type dipeptide/oligopeptide/nickel transport system permease component
MTQFIIRRTIYALISLFILSVTIFAIVRLTGDPVTMMAEPGARTEDLDRLRAEWGLDRSYPMQYLAFAKNVFTGDLGKSFNYQMPVTTLYFQRLPASLQLALAATLISFVIGIPAGLISAVKVNSAWDNAGKVVALFGLAVPGFWLGLVMILIFSVWLGWLPTSGQGGFLHLIMPSVALGWYFAASLLRLTRSSMLEVMRSEYIKLARLKGLPGFIVIAVHAFKNALIPVVTLAGINLVVMINAGVIIEVIFAWPGIGRLLYEGIFQRDFPLVQGVVLLAGMMIVLINLIIDIMYAYIDPRIRIAR